MSNNQPNKGDAKKEKLLDKIITEIKTELEEVEKLREQLEGKNKEIERLKNELKKQKELSRAQETALDYIIQSLQNDLAAKERDIKALNKAVEERNRKLDELKALLKSAPSFYASFVRANKDGTIDIIFRGERARVYVTTEVDIQSLWFGQKLGVIQFQNAIIVTQALSEDYQYDTGEQAKIKGFLDNNKIVVDYRGDQKVLMLAEPLLKIKEKLEVGDKILFDYYTGLAFAKLPKIEIEEVELEEIPNITYNDIGGLDEQIERIREEIEFPYLYSEEYKSHKAKMPKGLMLFGPPGNGKTMLGKALAHHLEREFAKKFGKEQRTGNFLLINGPELSSKWVGETERLIRELFNKGRKKYKETGIPVVMFFDEADSFLPTRGSRRSSDASDDYVTQFCVEIDGVEELAGIIVVLATNRIDKIDPAVLRPGRIDFKIRIGQPNEEAARDVLRKYLVPDLPYHKKYRGKEYKNKLKDNSIVEYLINRVIERIYSQGQDIKEKNKYVELPLKNDKTKILYFKDFVSCAALKNIVDRTKKKSIKNVVKGKERGIRLKMLYESIEEEFQENEGLPSSREAINEWLRMHGERLEIVGEPKFLTRKVEEKSKDSKDDYLEIV